MASAVEQDSAIGEARLVGNLYERHYQSKSILFGEALAKRLRGAEEANRLEGSQFDALLRNLHRVALFLLVGQSDRLFALLAFRSGRRNETQLNRGVLVIRSQLKLHVCFFLHPFQKELRNTGAFGIARVVANAISIFNGKHLVKTRTHHLHLLWKRDDVVLGSSHLVCRNRREQENKKIRE